MLSRTPTVSTVSRAANPIRPSASAAVMAASSTRCLGRRSLIDVEAITRRRSVGEVTPLLSLVVTTRHYRMFSILNNSWMTGSAALGEPLCDTANDLINIFACMTPSSGRHARLSAAHRTRCSGFYHCDPRHSLVQHIERSSDHIYVSMCHPRAGPAPTESLYSRHRLPDVLHTGRAADCKAPSPRSGHG